jgi:hypothetical protein
MRLRALPILSLVALACSARPSRSNVSSDCGNPVGRTRACAVTLSGALTSRAKCSVEPVYEGLNGEFLLRLSVESSSPERVGGPISVAVGFRGEPRIATYRNTDPGAKSVMYAYSSSYLEEWSETVAGPGKPQGRHALTITSVGTPFCLSGSKAYPQIQGTLDATLPASPSSGASGTVSLRATF